MLLLLPNLDQSHIPNHHGVDGVQTDSGEKDLAVQLRAGEVMSGVVGARGNQAKLDSRTHSVLCSGRKKNHGNPGSDHSDLMVCSSSTTLTLLSPED